MNFEVERCNGIPYLMNYRLRVDRLERHHIILRKVMMSYPPHYLKVALVDLFGRVNVIGL